MPVLVLSTLTLASLVGLGLQLYLSLPEPEEVFERTLGVPVSTDVTIVNLQQTGFGDHGSVSVCFQAAPETINHIIAARKLQPNSSPPADVGCVTASAAFYVREAGPGSGSGDHERVNGFSMTAQTLGYDAATRTAYYVFQGVD